MADVIERSQGKRRHLTSQEARWIADVRRAAPTLDGWPAYRMARLFMDGRDDVALEVLAFMARSDDLREGYVGYREAERAGWVSSAPDIGLIFYSLAAEVDEAEERGRER